MESHVLKRDFFASFFELLNTIKRGGFLEIKQIIKMLEYCGMSYSNFQPEFPYEKLIFIDDKMTDIQCFLRIVKNEIIIVFRGSDSKKDWKTDSKFWKTEIPYGNSRSKIRVHSGFINAYKSPNIRMRIQKYVSDFDIQKIYLTGHSYGAALAVLCAVDLEYNFPKKDYEVMVFGCPRVGNNAFKKSYNLRLFKTLRVENSGDIVTKIPFAFLGYRHVGAKFKIGKNKRGIPFSMKKHNLQEYYSNIWYY